MRGDFQVVGVHRDRQFSLCAPLFLLADGCGWRCRHPAAAALSTGLAAAHAYPQAEMQRQWSCRPTTARRRAHLAQGVYDGRTRAPYGLGLLMLLLLSAAPGCTQATSFWPCSGGHSPSLATPVPLRSVHLPGVLGAREIGPLPISPNI